MINKDQFVEAIAGGGLANFFGGGDDSEDEKIEGERITTNETMGEGPADWLFNPNKVRRLFKSKYLKKTKID